MKHLEPLRWRRRMIANTASDLHERLYDFRRNYTDATFWLHALVVKNAETPDGNRDYLNALCAVGGGDVWGFAFDSMGQRQHMSHEQMLDLITPKTATGEHLDKYCTEQIVAWDEQCFQTVFADELDRIAQQQAQELDRDLRLQGYHIRMHALGYVELFYLENRNEVLHIVRRESSERYLESITAKYVGKFEPSKELAKSFDAAGNYTVTVTGE